MARKRRTPPVEAVEAWFSRFWKPDQDRTSPEIRPSQNRFVLAGDLPEKKDAPPAPPVEPVPEPATPPLTASARRFYIGQELYTPEEFRAAYGIPASAPEPAPSPRPPPRKIRFLNGQVYEEGENGKLYLASDDGRQEENILTRWRRKREREVNFPDPEGGWKDG